MTGTLESVWIVPVNVRQVSDHFAQQLLLAFSPAYQIGAINVGGTVTWFSVGHDGQPFCVIDKPMAGPIDIILFRLAQAYTSILMASSPGNPPPWKA
jgi:hypothetical protein